MRLSYYHSCQKELIVSNRFNTKREQTVRPYVPFLFAMLQGIISRCRCPEATYFKALGFGVGVLMFDGLTLLEIAIIATMLAPTDAALGKAVVTNNSVPDNIREGLKVESGLNDGICVQMKNYSCHYWRDYSTQTQTTRLQEKNRASRRGHVVK